MDHFKNNCLYANPHSHHSYFTVLALSQVHAVLLLCPPLQLQLLRGLWSKEGLVLRTPNAFERLQQLISLFAFLLYKVRIVPETRYLAVLTQAASTLLKAKKGWIWVHYQDYLQLSATAQAAVKLDVCEMIISSDSSAANWTSTLQSAANADIVICPVSSISSSLPINYSKVYLAPYGGDKANYMPPKTSAPLAPAFLNGDTSDREIVIAARANSFRKGIDLLLSSLVILNKRFAAKGESYFRVQICGAVSELKALKHLEKVQKLLSRQNYITLSAKQLSPSDYLYLLQRSDLFVMPSRLEGSSPAALEALWLGTPCILSKACGVEAFQHDKHGLLLPELSSESLCDALYQLALDPSLLIMYRNHLERDKHRFTWNGYLDSYKQILMAADDLAS